jgi:hypothetical protein
VLDAQGRYDEAEERLAEAERLAAVWDQRQLLRSAVITG